MPKRKPVLYRLEVDPEAAAALRGAAAGTDLTQAERAARLVRWFLGQDELTQAFVLGLLSEEEVLRLAGDRNRENGRHPPDGRPAAADAAAPSAARPPHPTR